MNKLFCVLVAFLVFPFWTLAAAPVSKKVVPISGWIAETRDGDFEVGTDDAEKHSGVRSGYITSRAEKPKEFGNLMQSFVPREFLGKRLKMSAWVRSKISSGSAHCWARVDGDWSDEDGGIKYGSFDNMTDRPIGGATDWTQYSIVIDVPEESTNLWFGCMLFGTGQIWVDDFSFEVVSKDTPLTGISSGEPSQKQPANLNFEEEDNSEKAGATDVSNFVYGWNADHNSKDFEIGIDVVERHNGKRSAFVKSITKNPPEFGNIDQGFVPLDQLGKRIRMSAWVKTNLTTGTAQLWLRVDRAAKVKLVPALFDNMNDRPIKGVTEWRQYQLVCDVPRDGKLIAFGLMVFGEGQAWLDDVQFETVGKEVPLTGKFKMEELKVKTMPTNANFED